MKTRGQMAKCALRSVDSGTGTVNSFEGTLRCGTGILPVVHGQDAHATSSEPYALFCLRLAARYPIRTLQKGGHVTS